MERFSQKLPMADVNGSFYGSPPEYSESEFDDFYGCACQRIFCFGLCLPFILAASLLGICLWICLLPFQFCCSDLTCFKKIKCLIFKAVKLPVTCANLAFGYKMI